MLGRFLITSYEVSKNILVQVNTVLMLFLSD